MRFAFLLTLLLVVVGATGSANTITVSVNHVDIGHRTNFELDPSQTTVGALKQMIHEQFQAPLAEMELVHDNDIFRDDDATLDSYNLKNNADILLLVLAKDGRRGGRATGGEAAQISIRFNGKTFILNVHLSDTVISVKEMIKDKRNIPVERQHLIHVNDILMDTKTLDYYNIKNNDSILLLDLPPMSHQEFQQQSRE